MIAIEISQFGGPEVLRPVDRPAPEPGVNEVLVDVVEARVVGLDVGARGGRRPPVELHSAVHRPRHRPSALVT